MAYTLDLMYNHDWVNALFYHNSKASDSMELNYDDMYPTISFVNDVSSGRSIYSWRYECLPFSISPSVHTAPNAQCLGRNYCTQFCNCCGVH